MPIYTVVEETEITARSAEGAVRAYVDGRRSGVIDEQTIVVVVHPDGQREAVDVTYAAYTSPNARRARKRAMAKLIKETEERR